MLNNLSFIGLGNMGKPMALNLLKNQYNLVIYDINPELYNTFEKTKAKIAKKNSDITNKSSFIITMLPDGKALYNLVMGKHGLIKSIKKNSIFIDCSSSDYATTMLISKELKKKKILFLDAPVSGGVTGAKKGSLSIMVGGNKNAFNKSKNILKCLGKNIIHIGENGTGQIVKACNNMMLGINMIGICEAFLLAQKFGINQKKFYDICISSSSSSWAMENHLPIKNIVKNSAANNKFKPGYAAKLILRDLKISQEMSKNVKLKTNFGEKAFELYKKFCRQDKGELDYTAIINFLDKK